MKKGFNAYVGLYRVSDPVGFVVRADFIVKYGSNVYVGLYRVSDPDPVGFFIRSGFIMKKGSNAYMDSAEFRIRLEF